MNKKKFNGSWFSFCSAFVIVVFVMRLTDPTSLLSRILGVTIAIVCVVVMVFTFYHGLNAIAEYPVNR